MGWACGQGQHVVQFYSSDEELIRPLTEYVSEAVTHGRAAIVLATAAHLGALERALAQVIDVADARRNGMLLTREAHDVLGSLVTEDMLDPERFRSVIDDLVSNASGDRTGLCLYGELVGVLWDSGHVSAVLELERFWNDLARFLTFSLYCGYRITPDAVTDGRLVEEICDLHGATLPPGANDSDSPDTRNASRSASRSASRRFPNTVTSSADARKFAVDQTRSIHPEHADEVALLVSELSSNALMHGNSDFVVTIDQRADLIRISVADKSPSPPLPRLASPVEPAGRGLQLVSWFADGWGTNLAEAGKTVWVELRTA